MQYLNTSFKAIFILFITLFICACTPKQVSVKSLSPSLLHNKKIHNVILEDFINDNINQANYLEEKLVNMQIENKRVFNLQNNYENVDAIVTGEVIDASLIYDFYYDYETDYRRCSRYEYKDKKRTSRCLEYRERRIPCERRNYSVKSKIQVLNQNEEIIFSKIYTKGKRTNACFKNRYFYDPIFYRHLKIDRKQDYYNSKLANAISRDFINDIAPHYVYDKVIIIEDFDDDKVYSKEIKEEFNIIVDLLENKNINLANEKLHHLNIDLHGQSYEVLYNLALSYEVKNELKKAKDLYEKARFICNNIENLKLINIAINRTQTHLENKIKAKSQLP